MSASKWARTAALLLAAAGITSCAGDPGAARVERADPAVGRAALLRADSLFCAATAARGVDGWVSWFAPDGRQFASGGRMPVGHQAIRETMTPAFADPARSLTWRPLEAEISSDGTLGYTIGRYEAARRDSAGARQVAGTGRYVTIWRKQPGGEWRIVVDIGSPDPAPEAPPKPE